MEIYILAGQSNMAGRGSRRTLPPRYQAVDNQVMCFNAKGDWVPAAEPLHKDVDLRKQQKCGVGPALVCARALLELRKTPSPSSSQGSLTPIGLVPCAIGGASLDEWQKNYQGVVGDCETSTGPRKQGNHNRPWRYKPGSKNLFGAMAARTEEALQAAPEGSRLGGMLWYQGETDGAKEDRAETYYERFETLVEDIRGLGYPDLNIFTVAVTGSNGRLSFLNQVRDAQLRAGSSAGMSGVWVADALGLPMHRDGLHLLTNGQVELGERMALQVFEATEATDSRKEGSQIATCGWQRDLAEQDSKISRAEKDLHSIASMAKSKLESKSKHDAVRSEEPCGDREVKFRSFAKLLYFLDPQPEDRLLVLGCDAGSCVMASALLYDLGQIQVVESMQTSLDETRALLSEYSGNYSGVTGTTRGDSDSTPLSEQGVSSRRTLPSNIKLLEGDVADAPWADASLVFAASRGFDDTGMLGIARRCLGLRDGARVITLGKPLPSVLSDTEGEDTGVKEEFQVAWQCQMEGCWGGSVVVFVHHRVAPRR